MVEKYAGIYFDASQSHNTYDVGTHIVTTDGGSLRIPTGYTVRFYENEDTSGKRSRVLYEGTYEDLLFYLNIVGSRRFDVAETDLTSEDFVTVFEYKDTGSGTWYPCLLKVPPGNWLGGGVDCAYDDNAMDQISIPNGMTIYLHDSPTADPHIALQGPGHFNLATMRYENKVSRLFVEKDEWEVIEDVVDWDNGKEVSRTRINGTSGTFQNPSAATITRHYGCSYTKEESFSRTWEVGGSLTIGASVTAEGGIPLVGKVEATASMEATVSASGGGTDATTVTTLVEESLEIEVPPNAALKILAIYDKVKMIYPTYRKIRNKRTGAEIRQDTDLIAFQGTDSMIQTEGLPLA